MGQVPCPLGRGLTEEHKLAQAGLKHGAHVYTCVLIMLTSVHAAAALGTAHGARPRAGRPKDSAATVGRAATATTPAPAPAVAAAEPAAGRRPAAGSTTADCRRPHHRRCSACRSAAWPHVAGGVASAVPIAGHAAVTLLPESDHDWVVRRAQPRQRAMQAPSRPGVCVGEGGTVRGAHATRCIA